MKKDIVIYLLALLMLAPLLVFGQNNESGNINNQNQYSVHRVEVGHDGLVFPFDTWQLTPNRVAQLDSIAKLITPNCKKIEIEVIERLNKSPDDSLSLKRIHSIIEILEKNDIDVTIIEYQINPYVRKEESKPRITRFSQYEPDIFIFKIYY